MVNVVALRALAVKQTSISCRTHAYQPGLPHMRLFASLFVVRNVRQGLRGLGRTFTGDQILSAYVKPLDENTKAVIEALDAARLAQSTGSRSIQ